MAGAGFEPGSSELESMRELSNSMNTQDSLVDSKLIEKLIELRRKKDILETEVSLLNKQLEPLQQQIISQLLAAGMKSMRTDENVLISVVVKSEYSADNADKVRFARESSREDLLTVNSQTFSSEIRKLIESGENAPPYVSVHERKSLSVRGI